MMNRSHRPLVACKEFEPDLVLYYYGESPEEMKKKVEIHLKECSSCRGFLEELGVVLPLTVKPDEPSPDFWGAYSTEVRRKLAALEPKGFWQERLFPWLRPWPVPALAVAAVLLLVLTLSLAKGLWPPAQPPFPENELQTILDTKENMEFFESLEFLESMDLLESVESGRPGKKAA